MHQAADGALVRVRLPGGALTPRQLEALAHAATDLGGGTLELTSRGSLQIRGIREPGAVAEAIAAAGLLPTPTHERVRNIVASPLSGRAGGLVDVRGWVGELDQAIQRSAVLAGLPGRFWFSIDDGRGDVTGLRADAGVRVVTADGGELLAALHLAGVDTGVRLPVTDCVPVLVTLAERFQALRGTAWRVGELADTAVLLDGFTPIVTPGDLFPAQTRPPIGWLDQHDGRVSLGAAVPLGVLPARTAEFLAAAGSPLIVTPWRSVLVCDLDEAAADVCLRVLAPLGLVFDETSPWLSVSACTGSPGCERSHADVRADAVAAVEELSAGEQTLSTHRHFVGCERACGSPLGAEVLIATPEGYRTRADPPVG